MKDQVLCNISSVFCIFLSIAKQDLVLFLCSLFMKCHYVDYISFNQQIVPPVLSSFSDHDSRVRYYACEALYNIAKVRTNITAGVL